MSRIPINADDLRSRFLDYERTVRIQNYKVGCILGIIFMPAGISLDTFVYPEQTGYFMLLRLLCSGLLAVVWALLLTETGKRFYRALGLVEVSLPIFFISWMIAATEGSHSPYYAGITLVIMGAGIVLRWNLADSIAVLLIGVLFYLGACLIHGPITEPGIFYNNIYFLTVTGVFVITGNYFYNLLRFRDFALRFELDENRKLLEENNRRLIELDEVKTRFFANISHELRTPLTLLLAPLEHLLHRGGPAFEAKTQEHLQLMHANGMRLLKLINDLLDLVRLESGGLEIRKEPVPVAEFLKGLVATVRRVADDKRLRLETDVPPDVASVQADRDKLEKVVLNLVFNAIKFTPAGGRVDVRARRSAAGVVIEVRDTGMGISEEDLPFVFDRFWQGDTSSQRKYQGTGIGLSLVKELVEAHGGRVSVESRPGQGTCMTVTLPDEAPDEAVLSGEPPPLAAVAATAPPGRREHAAEDHLAGLYRRAELFPSLTSLQQTLRPMDAFGTGTLPKLLIADDEPDMLRFLRSQLEQNYQIFEAVDGLQAIAKAGQFLPDVILIDMMMPEKDGLQVCRELRANSPTRNLPIIMLTARADEETKLAALASGANDFLTKPFSSTELQVRLKNLTDSHLLQRKLARQNQILEATLEQLKETELQFLQHEKLASLGRLSAGLIHEINNPLNYAKTGVYTLKSVGRSLPPEELSDYDEVLGDIEEGIDRVRTIVSDLRSFTHTGAGIDESVDVGKVIESALRFLSHEWKGRVTIINEVSSGEAVVGSHNKLVQVLVNLLQNALDALKEPPPSGQPPTIRIRMKAAPGKRILAVRDNGQGIPPEVADKIFDPFFTTKDVGQGMGLGLSICYKIMEEHGGRIAVESKPGVFSEFALEFPDNP